jgi:uncharacterized protein YggE
MFVKHAIVLSVFVAFCAAASAQQTSQAQLKIEPANRTLTVSAMERVTAEPELAILHIGFETLPMDAKAAYAAGAKTSNDIIAALKQAGIPESSIRSESQNLQSLGGKTHKFKLVQEWTVKTTPLRAAEILDITVGAGATDSGEIDWIVLDVQALENQALERASARARADAAVLAKSMGVHLGSLVFVTNQTVVPGSGNAFGYATANFAGLNDEKFRSKGSSPLAIEPHKVSRVATVYAVYAIE